MKSSVTHPSINQYRNVLKYANRLLRGDDYTSSKEIVFEGTVKMHGCNSGIVIHPDETNSYQSKNQIIDIGSDNYGFATYMRGIEDTEAFLQFRQAVIDYVGADVSNKHDIVVYGEWCGEGIQKGVGLSAIGKKIFVVFGISVVESPEYNRFIEMHNWRGAFPIINIFYVGAFGNYRVVVDLKYPQLAQQEMIELTNEIERECPVAKSFGVSGIGEGVVYKCITEGLENNPDLWFKVKGKKHSVSKVKVLAAVDVEKVKNIKEFVEYAVTESRLEQGVEFLIESKLPIDITSTGKFIQWIFHDVVKEESDVMEENDIDKKELGTYLNVPARDWWKAYLDTQAGL